MGRLSWPAILRQATEIVESYDTDVTLRQLYYRLVAAQVLANTRSSYTTLSSKTAEARRNGTFPELADLTRRIERSTAFDDPGHGLSALAGQYRRDRTEGQGCSVYIGVEKKGLVAQLRSWFGDFGIPIIALGGYSSQTYVDQVRRDVHAQERPAVLLYAGDFDPSGEDIDRDFVERTDCFGEVRRIALNSEQVIAYDLPPAMGKTTDTRSTQFIARHGRLVQVELDALAPPDLRSLYQSAIDDFFDLSAFDGVVTRERHERRLLTRLANMDMSTIEMWLGEAS